jgi:hypothetical protein
MNLKFLNPLHILFASFALLWAVVSFFVQNNPKLDTIFLLLINIVLWLTAIAPAYLFYKSLQSKRIAPSLSAITGSVIIKLLTIVIFVVVYQLLTTNIPIASLCFGAFMYLVYSLVYNMVMQKLNKLK